MQVRICSSSSQKTVVKIISVGHQATAYQSRIINPPFIGLTGGPFPLSKPSFHTHTRMELFQSSTLPNCLFWITSPQFADSQRSLHDADWEVCLSARSGLRASRPVALLESQVSVLFPLRCSAPSESNRGCSRWSSSSVI